MPKFNLSRVLQGLGNVANVAALVFLVWAYYHPLTPRVTEASVPASPTNVRVLPAEPKADWWERLNVVPLGGLALFLIGGGLNMSAVLIRRRERGRVPSEGVSLNNELLQARNERDAVIRELQQAITQRQGMEQALATCKRAFALARLTWLAERVAANGGNPGVTIRFAEYADFALVKAIRKIFDEHTKWPVTEERPNSPVIPPSEGLKVIFVLSKFEAFSQLASIFDEGRLVEGTVGIRRDEHDDSSQIVIEVRPTVAVADSNAGQISVNINRSRF